MAAGEEPALRAGACWSAGEEALRAEEEASGAEEEPPDALLGAEEQPPPHALLGAEEEASDPTARRTEWGQKIPSSQRAIDSGTRLLGSTEEEALRAEEEASGAEEEPPDAFLGTGGEILLNGAFNWPGGSVFPSQGASCPGIEAQ
jgi:hypothetical protein